VNPTLKKTALRWSSPNGRNFAVSTLDHEGLCVTISGKNYYLSQRWPDPKKQKKRRPR